MGKFWSYVGYIVKSYDLVILWSYDIEGREEWEFGQIVGCMWYFHCGVGCTLQILSMELYVGKEDIIAGDALSVCDMGGVCQFSAWTNTFY